MAMRKSLRLNGPDHGVIQERSAVGGPVVLDAGKSRRAPSAVGTDKCSHEVLLSYRKVRWLWMQWWSGGTSGLPITNLVPQ